MFQEIIHVHTETGGQLIQLIAASVEFQIFYYTSTLDSVLVETYIHI